MTRPSTTHRRGEVPPGMRQLFVAAPLPADAVRSVSEVVERVRAAGSTTNGRDVRWVRLEGLHLTLRFLGPTADGAIPGILAAVRRAAAERSAFRVVIDGAGAFPSPARPRALFLDVVDGAAELAELAHGMDEVLLPLGWPRPDRPFRAHLTLARSDGVAAGPRVAARLADAARDLALPATIGRVGVFESLTGGGPARYEPLDLVELA